MTDPEPSEPTPPKPAEPGPPEKATIWGPRTGELPVVGSEAGGALPYAARERQRQRRLLVGGAALVVVVLVGLGLALVQRDDSGGGQRAATVEPTTAAPRSAPQQTRTSSPPTTAATPTSPPVSAAPVTVPGPAPPPHEAVYRDGKLYLQGAVPDGATGQKLYDKAAAVVGKDNVVGGYLIDSRVPPQTDGRVVVDQRFVFPSGSATLDPTYSNVLELGFIVMTQNPQVTMVINGHSDSTGNENQNVLLSQARASAVVSYYMSRGIDASRFIPIGHGSAQPVAPNETPEGRAQNRRIEVSLLHLIG